MAKTVLIAVNRFPMNGGARFDKFAKYLPLYGWKPHVLTIHMPGDFYLLASGIDRGQLLAEYSSDLEAQSFPLVSVARRLKPFRLGRVGARIDRYLLVPDICALWVPYAVRAGLALRDRFDVICTTSPEESLHLAGWILKRLLGKPWVADFQDLWTSYIGRYHPVTPIHDRLCRWLEKRFYQDCDHIVANTPLHRQVIQERFQVKSEKITVITNGFDPDDFVRAVPTEMESASSHPGPVRIGYMGGFEKGKRLPTYEFLKALKAVNEALPDQRLELHVWGSLPSQKLEAFLTENGIRQYATFYGWRTHHEAVHEIAICDWLLVYMSATEQIYDAVVPQKLYQYFGLRRPILAVVPTDGVAANIVRTTRTGIVVGPEQQAIEDALRRIVRDWAQGDLVYRPDDEEIKQHSYLELSRRLVEVLEHVAV